MEENITNNQKLLAQAVNEVILEDPKATKDVQGFMEKVTKKFLNNKLDDFPRMCDIARIQNKIKFDDLAQYAKRGKFDAVNNQETYWSDDGTFMFDYEIPEDLYVFMQTFVYKHFWENDNAKVWRPFMKAICARHKSLTNYEAMNLLIKVKQIYGSNSDSSLTR